MAAPQSLQHGAGVAIDGASELRSFFQMMANPARQSEITYRGLRLGAKPIQNSASNFAPFDTGVLEDNIKIVGTRNPMKGTAHVKVQTGKKAFYGKFLEFGTKFHRPQPFMLPAAMTQGERSMSLAMKSMRRDIILEFARMAKRG